MPSNVLMFEFLGVDHFGPTADHVGKKLDGIGSKMGAVGKTTAMAIGKLAVGGVAAFGFAMFKGIQAATEYQTLQLKTAAVIKSTGNVAHLSVAGIDKLAGSLESISGVDETLIINSENVLATFTNVRNAAGKNNDVFNQATGTILDMSVALGTDLQGSTIQVGKALNDPIKGITALTRVGVTFSAAQKEQIKHLQETGDLMGAQKIVLGELNREFGGAAKAAGQGFAGSLARLKDVLDDTFRDLGTAVLPVLTKVASWLADKLPGAIAATGHALSALGGWLAGVGRAIWGFVGPFVQKAIAGLKVFWDALTGHSSMGEFEGYLHTFNVAGQKIYDFVRGAVKALSVFWDALRGKSSMGEFEGYLHVFNVAGQAIYDFALKAWHNLGRVWAIVLQVGKAIGGTLAVGIRIVVHYFRDLLFPALRDAGAKVFPQIRTAIATIGAAFRDHMDIIRTFGQVFVFILKIVGVALAILALTLVKVVIPVIAELIVIVFKAVGPIVRALLTITGVLITVIKGIAGFAVKAVSTIANVIGDIIGAFSNANKWLVNAGTKIIMGLIAGFNAAKSFIGGIVKNVINDLISPFLPAIKWLMGPGKNFVMGLLRGVASLYTAVTSAVANFITRYLIAPFSKAVGWLLSSGKNIIVGLIRGYVSQWVRVATTVANFISRYLLAPYARAISWLVGKGAAILTGLLNGLRSMRDRVTTWIGGIITSIKNRFASAAKWLWNAGFNVLWGFWQGLKSIWDKVTGWVKGIGKWIADHKGPIHLDAQLLIPAGKAIMQGFLNGLKSGAGKAWSFVKSIGGKTVDQLRNIFLGGMDPDGKGYGHQVQGGPIGSGVARWAPLVSSILKMEGLSPFLLTRVMRQMQTESGGNPNAINLTDSNARAGYPSKGLMQTIPQTFAAYHWPGTSWNIYDPTANIAAALNYARARYGPDLGFLGQGHGYDSGGLARGAGWWHKGPQAERILSPRQTAWFERAMMAQSARGGRGHGGVTFVLNAPNYVGSRRDLLDEFNRFARLGHLDAIVRMAGR